ncbi:uncharacterized protein [Epargyreus clarus]|uniref:uncharacterized protein n=1 Tax=Epargyreus clarus TaxID=520877 RepID=UPI003C304608
MGDVTYCSVCLATDVKMFEMSPTALRIYEELVAIQNTISIKQMYACYECAYLLHKYAEFKTKCHKAYGILQSFTEVTVDNLKSIDRKQSKLESKLTTVACVAAHSYLPDKNNKLHSPDKMFIIEKVKSESFVDSSEGQEIEYDIYISEEMQSSNNETGIIEDTLNNDDHRQVSRDNMKTEFIQDYTQQNALKNHFQSGNMLEVNSLENEYTKKDDAAKIISDDVKMELDVESIHDHDNPNDVLSEDKVDFDSDTDDSNAFSDGKVDFDSDSDELNEILARYPLPNCSYIRSESKKRKIKSPAHNKVTRKRKSEIKKDLENIKVKSVSYINKKQLTKILPQRNKTKSVKVFNRDKRDRRFTFDPNSFKDYATIITLTPEDARKEVLLRKESTNYKQSKYKCELCYRGFLTPATYENHMNKHTLEHGSHECEFCQMRFSKRCLAKHLLACHSRKFLCEICPYICYSPIQAKNHMNSHKGKTYPCNECGEKFKLPHSLLSHTHLKHSLEHVCDICGSTFGSKHGLLGHKKRSHARVVNEHQGPRCEECDVHFATEMAWKRHLVLCSKHSVSNGCSICGDTFPDAASRRAHMKVHGPQSTSVYNLQRNQHDMDLDNICKYCEVQLSNSREYKQHMTTEHPQSDIAQAIMKIKQKYVCEKCGKTFRQLCFLQLHQHKHTGEKPFSCTECDKKFSSLKAVKAHESVHTKIFPYKCHICDKAFGDKAIMTKHVKYHLEKRSFKCWGCDKAFLFKYEMNNHAQYVHKKVPWPKRDRSKRGSDLKGINEKLSKWIIKGEKWCKMGDVTYCSVCLATDVKMFEMSPTALRIYEELVSIQDTISIKQMYACYECAYLLHKYAEFKTKCNKAYSILQSFTEVTVDNLQSIDREQNKLKSKLTTVRCVAAHSYLPDKNNKLHSPDKIFSIGKVKSESFVDSSERQEIEEEIYIREKLQPCNNETGIIGDTLNEDDHREFSSDNMKIEFIQDNTQHNELENHFQSVNMLEVNGPDYDRKKDIAAKIFSHNVKIELEVESIHNHDIPNDVLSEDKLDCSNDSDDSNALSDDKLDFDSDSDELNEILVRYPISNCGNTSAKSKKRKIKSPDNTARNKVTKKRKGAIKKESENIKVISVSDINKKQLSKKVPQRNKTKSVKVLKRDKKDRRFSFDPTIFKDYATIILLTPEDARRDVLLRKESANYKQSLYKCELCYRGFITQATYETHMNKHSLEYGSYECEICQFRFSGKKYLGQHRLACHTRKFLCKICPYICYSPIQAKNHMDSHKGKKYPCKECAEVFKLPNSLLTHTRLKHSVELVCDICGSTFGSKHGLQVHKKKVHKKVVNEHQGPRCEECDVHFATEMAWKRHLVLCSKHSVSNGCSICGDTFPVAASLKAHVKVHGPQASSIFYQQSKQRKMERKTQPINCKHCEVQLSNNKEYKQHMTTEHPQTDIAQAIIKVQQKKCVCEICGMMFTHPCFLQAHQRKHTGEKPYSCTECDKKFSSPMAAKAHESVHTKIFPYKCHICDKAYGDKGRLTKHIKYHLDKRSYKCWGCDKTFLFKYEMNNHAQYVHEKVPWPKRDRAKRGSDLKD